MTKLDYFIRNNLPKVLAEDTANTLGDRSQYIGASDIGSSCLRKAYLSKKTHVEHSIAQHIVFQRGHIAEDIVAKMLQGTPYKRQEEVKGETKNGFPIKAHIDFTVDFGKEYLVIEAKSTSIDVDEPYESWVLQTQFQIYQLNQKYPNKRIRGYIIAMNVNNGWYKTFEIKKNKALADIANNRANLLADCLINEKEPEAEEQLYCSQCAFKSNCPAITNSASAQELPKDVRKIVEKIAAKSSVEKEIKELKKQLKDFFEAANLKAAKAGEHSVKLVTVKGKKSIDKDLLKSCAPDIYKQVEYTAQGYSFLKVV